MSMINYRETENSSLGHILEYITVNGLLILISYWNS